MTLSFHFFNFPQQAAFGKILPKSKIYEFSKPSNAIKDLFVKQVEQVIWEYKLSPETTNISAGDGVQEIQILKIQSKVVEIDENVLRTIDEAIPSHIFYVIVFGNKKKLIAAYKRQSEADSGKWVTGSYFQSDWVTASESGINLPIALNMGGLYAQMLRSIMPVEHKEGESLKAQAERLDQLRLKNGELVKLEIKLAKEKQFNRKIEINAQLKKIKNQIIQLT